MRTVLLANNVLGERLALYLHGRGDLAGLVVHPDDRRKAIDPGRLPDVPTWTWPDGLDDVRAIGPECLLSVLFGYRIPRPWLEVPSWRAVNLHPGLLPWNRGAAPNVWPLVDGSPAGVTLHEMDDTFDTGGILVQREVVSRPDDTGLTLYQRLEAEGEALFREAWPTLGLVEPTPQVGAGSTHRLKDLTSLDLDPRDFAVLDRMRARTFPPHGAEFERAGRRYVVRVEIEPLDT